MSCGSYYDTPASKEEVKMYIKSVFERRGLDLKGPKDITLIGPYLQLYDDTVAALKEYGRLREERLKREMMEPPLPKKGVPISARGQCVRPVINPTQLTLRIALLEPLMLKINKILAKGGTR